MPMYRDGKFIYEKNFGFGLKGMKNFWELIPLVGVISGALIAGTAFMGYSLYQKPDVRLRKWTDEPPHERVTPETPQKLFTIKQEYHRIPELEALRKEIGSYKS